MWKRSDQLLKEYPRTNKTATRVVNNIYVLKSEPLEMARFSERERRWIRNCFNCFWLVCLIGLPTSSLYNYGRPGFPPLRWPRWPSGLTNKARPTAPTRPRRPQINFISTDHNSQHFILGMGRATRKLPNSVILSYHQTNITLSQERYDTSNHTEHHQWHTFPLCHTIYHLIICSV